jgi:hypothetical protein
MIAPAWEVTGDSASSTVQITETSETYQPLPEPDSSRRARVELRAVFNGPHPETGEELEVVDDPP